MTNEDRIAALFAEANPVPSLDLLDPLEPLDIDPLKSRSKRSSVMTDLKTDRSKVPAKWPRLALLAAVPVIVVAGFFLLDDGTSNVPEPSTPAAPLGTPAPLTTTAPSTTASPAVLPIDTSDWARYESGLYGFRIGYPSDWIVRSADHHWTMAEDADDWMSSGHDAFILPNEIRVSAWSVALDPGTTPETRADIEAWVEQYCEVATPSCQEYDNDRAVPLCHIAAPDDCPPGLLVPFRQDVHAFLADGTDRILVVAIWRVDGDPSVEPYGGAQRLLKAFLSTMGWCPADNTTLGC